MLRFLQAILELSIYLSMMMISTSRTRSHGANGSSSAIKMSSPVIQMEDFGKLKTEVASWQSVSQSVSLVGGLVGVC